MGRVNSKCSKTKCKGSYTGVCHATNNADAATDNVKKNFTKTRNAYR